MSQNSIYVITQTTFDDFSFYSMLVIIRHSSVFTLCFVLFFSKIF